MRLSDLTRSRQAIATKRSASVWDVGDGVACVEFHTKANALDPHSMDMIREALAGGESPGARISRAVKRYIEIHKLYGAG